jgi:ligand-binding sensor domain-containing protein/AraC-like DNA-binding protein
MKFIHIIGLLFFIYPVIPLPTSASQLPERYINRVWTAKDGLPQNTISDITQDKNGYMWIATDDGLARFDGIRFRVFNKYNTDALKSNSITCLLLGRDGGLWIGTFGGGLTLYRNNTFKNFDSQSGLESDFIWAIAEDRAGNLWVGTNGSGLRRRQRDRFGAFTAEQGLSNNIIRTICQDHQGDLWVGSESGLFRLENGKIERYTTSDGLSDTTITAVCEDSRHNLWVGTIDGLNRYRYSGGGFFTYTSQNGLASNLVMSIMEDREQNIWVATEGGLSRYRADDDRFETFSGQLSLSDHILTDLFEDREGNLWIGTASKGLNMLHRGRFTVYDSESGLSSNFVRSVFQDSRGALWIGTYGGGLNLIRDGKVSVLTKQQGLPSNFVNTICSRGQGGLWVGTQRGFARCRDDTIDHVYYPDAREDRAVLCLYEDREGDLWIGTQGHGLYRYDRVEERFYGYTIKEGLSNNFVISITQDPQGALWVGTVHGLNRIRDNTVTVYTQIHGLTNDTIYDIYCDPDGVIWIGTNGGGLNCLKDGKFTAFGEEHGLFHNVIYRILEDQKGYLWMTSNRGIFSVAKGELHQVAAGKKDTFICSYFQESDGIKSAVCSGGVQPAGWKGIDGALYFPTNKGVAAINPETIELNQVKPTVVIEKMWVNGTPQPLEKDLKLPADVDSLKFQFTALSFTIPEKVAFSYRLFGFDQEWRDTHSRESIVYTDLRPGKYRFKLVACNNDGIWNYKGASHSFRIKQKFYQTFGFIVASAIFLFSLLLFLLHRRRRLVQERGKGKKYQASPLTPYQSRLYLQQLLTYMREEQPYTDPELSLAGLATQLSIPPKQLSQIINEELEQNFKNFLNQYRVEEAQKKLLDPKEKDFVILKIAYEVGFNSKSVFNAAFKNFTGMSPSEYRKKFSDL